MQFKTAHRDLLVAAHGRGLFVLHATRPIEELNAQTEAGDFHLFNPAPGTNFHHWRMGEGDSGYTAPNAPEGVVIDYFLKSKLEVTPEQRRQHETPVKIVITDARGQTVNTVYGPSAAGVNRFVWNMRYEGAKRIEAERPSEEEQAAAAAAFGFGRGFGPPVLAGVYHVAVSVKGQTEKTDVQVEPDPTVHIDTADFRAQTEAALEARNKLSALNEMINRIDNWQHELTAFETAAQADQDTREKYKAILDQAHSLDGKLKALKATVYDPDLQRGVGEDDIHYLSDFQSQLQSAGFGGYGEPPTPLEKQRLTELSTQLEEHLKAFNDLLRTDVEAYDKAAYAAGAPTLFVGPVLTVQATPQLPAEGR